MLSLYIFMVNMMDVLTYIRSILDTNRNKRKRSNSELFEESNNPKQRFTGHIHNKLSTARTLKMESDAKPKLSSAAFIEAQEKKLFNGVKSRMPISSTPCTSSKANGFNITGGHLDYDEQVVDLTDRTNTLRDRIESPEKGGTLDDKFNISRPSTNNSSYHTPRLSMVDLTIPTYKKYTPTRPSPVLYQLQEKEKYSELISKTQAFAKAFSGFRSTPARGGLKRLDLLKKPIDLTGPESKDTPLRNGKTATSSKILKVLDNMDKDVTVIIDDGDSLPRPPSPKPDIQVERVNSLKTIVECDALKEDWLQEKIRNHQKDLAQKKKVLAEQQAQLDKVREITSEILRVQLSDQVRRCIEIKEVVIPIEIKEKLPELTDKQEQMVRQALDKRANVGAVLSSKFSLNISRRDMLTLDGMNWLNDEVINFYMNLIIERGKLDKYPNTYAFNTFFYPKICKGGQESVRRWTRRVDIFAQDFVCVPIHLNVHWCMAIIDFRKKKITYYDSMGNPNRACTEHILRYLHDEHKDKKQANFDSTEWQLHCPSDIPHQMNGSDCGVFSCMFAEFVTRKAELDFSQENMPYFRRKMVLEILNGQLLIQ